MWRLFAALVLLVGPDSTAAAELLAANPPLPSIKVTLTARGQPHRYVVEVARTPVEQARGLMVRKAMARDHGMIFPMDPPRDAAFWMEGTALPLDLIFIKANSTIGRIAANAVPFDRSEIRSGGPVAAVLELDAGEAERIGLRAGDAVSYALDGGRQPR